MTTEEAEPRRVVSRLSCIEVSAPLLVGEGVAFESAKIFPLVWNSEGKVEGVVGVAELMERLFVKVKSGGGVFCRGECEGDSSSRTSTLMERRSRKGRGCVGGRKEEGEG